MNTDENDRHSAQLDRELRALANDVEPERDLWPDIEARMNAKRPTEWKSLGLAAAVCLAVLAGSVLWMSLNSQRGDVPVADVTPPLSTAPTNTLPIELERPRMQLVSYPGEMFSKTREFELAELHQRIESLPQAERDVVLASLAVIDLALSDIDKALAADPDNALLKELLMATYQKELETIATVNRFGGTTRGDL